MENKTTNNQPTKDEAQYMPTPETQIHLETLVTPAYANNVSPNAIMEVLDGMINTYLRDTKSTLINVVQFGFDDVDEENIRGFARIAVKRSTVSWIMDKIKDAPQEVKDILAKIPTDILSKIPNMAEGTANGDSQ